MVLLLYKEINWGAQNLIIFPGSPNSSLIKWGLETCLRKGKARPFLLHLQFEAMWYSFQHFSFLWLLVFPESWVKILLLWPPLPRWWVRNVLPHWFFLDILSFLPFIPHPVYFSVSFFAVVGIEPSGALPYAQTFCILFWNRVSLNFPGGPPIGSHPASASQVARVTCMCHHTQFHFTF